MTDDRWNAMGAVARRLALAAALVFLAAYLFVALKRIDYPFEIEWMEGGSAGHVARLLAGEGLYVPPTLAFTPFIYTPLYFHGSAWLARLLGEGFLPLRLVSFLSSLLCLALLGRFVARESGDRRVALLAAGLFAASFEISGAWFDIARVDALFLLFTLASLTLLHFGKTLPAAVAAGVLGGCAFFTKQTALLVLAPFLLCALVARVRLWIAFSATLAAVVAIGCLLLDARSDGWFCYYVFELPAQHHLRWWQFWRFWQLDVLARLPVAAAAAVAFFGLRRFGASDPRRLFFPCLAVGTLSSSLVSRLHSGGYENVLLPAYAGLAIFFGLGVNESLRSPLARRRPAVALVIGVLCLIQFAMLAYDPRKQIPSERDRAAGERLVETIRSFEGDVLVVNHGYLAGLAGKRRTAHWMAISDILRADDGLVKEGIEREIREAIRERRFAAIITDGDWYERDLEAHYELRGSAFDDESVFWTRTGMRTRPERIYVPRPPDAS
jgi:4-amino-4-deoxy-L-arabinose transferase-like glycosyltransferase